MTPKVRYLKNISYSLVEHKTHKMLLIHVNCLTSFFLLYVTFILLYNVVVGISVDLKTQFI